MSAVKPEERITGEQPGVFSGRMTERRVTRERFNLLNEYPDAPAMLIELLAADPVFAMRCLVEARASLTARPMYGDHLLATRGIRVIAGAERGRNVPEGTALGELKPKTFLLPGESFILGTQVQARALDESGHCYAPWGRGLAWLILDRLDAEGDAFLLDRSKLYVFAGDKDLRGSGGSAVMLYLFCSEGRWFWGYGYVDSGSWSADVRLFTLGNSPS